MYKDSLFDLIRNEEVIIWAGAGLSISAGYPTGKELGEILVENLSLSEKEQINKTLPLPDLAEEIFRLKGGSRNYLIKILRQVFKKKPINTDCHRQISDIPHFKTIITTNYDTLLEDEFGDKAQVILSTDDIPYLEKGKKQIFKVHGDLKEPNSVIITRTDYNRFFKNSSENDVYWTVIKERLSTNTVLFIGYNLEDPNVSVIFDRITEALGANRKECFLIAPNLPPQKVNDLYRKQIHYINSTAAEFFAELIQNLKEHILEDLENGKTSADTVREFLSNIKLLPNLSADDKNFKVHSIHSSEGTVEGKMNFSVIDDPEFIKELNSFIAGEKLGSIEIPEDKLINADFWYGGIKMPSTDGISKLIFKSNPSKKAVVDIRFDDGLEIVDVTIEVYTSISTVEVHVLLKNAKLEFCFPPKVTQGTEYKFNYKHNETSTNVRDEIELYTLLDNLGKGKRFTIFIKDGEKYSVVLPALTPILKESEYFLKFFENIKLIEKHYNVRFSDFNAIQITESTYNTISLLLALIKNGFIEYNWDKEINSGLYDYSDQAFELLKHADGNNLTLVEHIDTEETVELLGQSIRLGYKVIELVEPLIVNLKDVIEKGEKVLQVKSRRNKIRVSYKDSKDGQDL